MVERRAMIECAALADRLGDSGAASYYRQVGDALSHSLENFWNPQKGILQETLEPIWGQRKDSGLDVGVVLGVIHGEPSDGFFSASDEKVLATAQAIMQAFRAIYPINQDANLGPAIGRY